MILYCTCYCIVIVPLILYCPLLNDLSSPPLCVALIDYVCRVPIMTSVAAELGVEIEEVAIPGLGVEARHRGYLTNNDHSRAKENAENVYRMIKGRLDDYHKMENQIEEDQKLLFQHMREAIQNAQGVVASLQGP